MIEDQDVISIGIQRRTQSRDLPPFVFVRRDGLLVPYRAERIAELFGEEVFILRTDAAEEDEGTLTWQDLVGFTVMDERRETKGKGNREWTNVGVIAHIDEQTINTLATLEDGRMLPLHEDFITDIDTEARIIRVNLPFEL